MAELNRMNELLVYSEQTGTLFLGKSLGPLGIGKIAFVWVPNKYSLDFFFLDDFTTSNESLQRIHRQYCFIISCMLPCMKVALDSQT